MNQGSTPAPDPFEAPLAGLHGDAAVRRRLATYASLLYERNARLNLTGARTPAAIAEQIRDSLTVLPYAREPLIDIGSGGGFPAVPLAVATGWEVTLVESVAKKARFLEEVADRLGLSLRVVMARAEELARDAAYRERFASATARAVGTAPTVLELAIPFLALGGRAVLQRGTVGPREREAIVQAGLVLGAELLDEVLLEADGVFSSSRSGRRPQRGSHGAVASRPSVRSARAGSAPPTRRPAKGVDARARQIDRLLGGALPPGSLYAVGGRVRDEVRSSLDGIARPAKDLDYIAVGLELTELVARLRRVGKTDVVGASFAVVKCTIAAPDRAGSTTVDVALPRRERSTGLGHREFTVEAGPDVPLKDDLARRDFRMNMLARALPEGMLVDPYRGEADIRARRIDVLRAEAFEEDPLRMLRACQFAARFEYAVTEATMAVMRTAAPLVTSVSAERVRDELMKLLSAERPSIGIELMRRSGVLPFVLPELAEGIGVEQNQYHAYDVYRHALETLDATPVGDTIVRLAALLHDVGKPRTKDGPHFYRHETVGADMGEDLLTRLRFPGETVASITKLVRNHMYAADAEAAEPALRRFIRRVGPENLERQFALRAADIVGSGLPKRGDENERFQARVRVTLAARPPLSVRDLALSGEDVLAALVTAGRLPSGSRGGPEVGTILRSLLERVVDDPALNERELLLGALHEALGPRPA